MLVLSLFLVGSPLFGGGTLLSDALPAVTMAEVPPQEPRFQFPFTREEYVRAHFQVKPRNDAEALASGLFDQDPSEVIGFHVMDGDLLLLAALSEDLASRVVAYRPKLSDLVQTVRADPEAFLKSWRTDADSKE